MKTFAAIVSSKEPIKIYSSTNLLYDPSTAKEFIKLHLSLSLSLWIEKRCTNRHHSTNYNSVCGNFSTKKKKIESRLYFVHAIRAQDIARDIAHPPPRKKYNAPRNLSSRVERSFCPRRGEKRWIAGLNMSRKYVIKRGGHVALLRRDT